MEDFTENTAPVSESQDYEAHAAGAPEDASHEQPGAEHAGEEQAKGPKGVPDPNYAFKRTQQENYQLRLQLERMQGQMEAMQQFSQQPPSQGTAAQREQMRDLMSMSDEELDEMWHDNRKGFLQTFAQQLHAESQAALRAEFDERMQKSTQETQRKQQFYYFVNKNPDFVDLFETGQIEGYMRQYPGASEREAYYALTREAQLQQASNQGRSQALAARAGKAHLPPQGGTSARRNKSNLV